MSDSAPIDPLLDMGNRMGHTRKLEPVDNASGPGPRKGLDISITDPTDSQILVGQTVVDSLESDPSAPPDQLISDGRDDKDKVDPSRTDVLDHDTPDKDAGYDDSTSRIETIRTTAMLEKVTEGTTGRRRYQLSWTQRVLSWFRRN